MLCYSSVPLCAAPAAVGEFRKLALLAEADGHLRQKLQQVRWWRAPRTWLAALRGSNRHAGSDHVALIVNAIPRIAHRALVAPVPTSLCNPVSARPTCAPALCRLPRPLPPPGAQAEQGEVGGGAGPRHACCGGGQPHAHLVRGWRGPRAAWGMRPRRGEVERAVVCAPKAAPGQHHRSVRQSLWLEAPGLVPAMRAEPARSAPRPPPPPAAGTLTRPTWRWACCSPAGWAMWTWTVPWVSRAWPRAQPAPAAQPPVGTQQLAATHSRPASQRAVPDVPAAHVARCLPLPGCAAARVAWLPLRAAVGPC